MSDFLTFNSFITPDILILFYYIGAIGVPVFLWYSKNYLLKKFSFFQDAYDGAGAVFGTLSKKQQRLTIALFLAAFLFMELMLRMMFEMIIAYFDIHDYLYEIQRNLQ